jgi:hypothetical protein
VVAEETIGTWLVSFDHSGRSVAAHCVSIQKQNLHLGRVLTVCHGHHLGDVVRDRRIDVHGD